MKPVLFLMAFFVLGSVAQADYLQPTDSKDCHVTRIPLWDAKIIQSEQAHACSKQSEYSIFRRGESAKTSCGGIEVKDCVHYHQRVCDMRDRLDAVTNTCYAKLREYRLREKEIRQAQEDFERAQRERSDAERARAQDAHREQMRQQTRFWQDSTRYAMNNNLGPEGKHALQMQSQARSAGKYGMRILGIQKPFSGGHFLSDQLTRAGTRFILGANAAAQQDLRNALAGFDDSLGGGGYNSLGRGTAYGPSNPRPTSSQIERSFALYGRLQEHIQRVGQTKYKLPLGNASVVDTATGRLLSRIVKARASGDINSLSDALTQYVGAVILQAVIEHQGARTNQSPSLDLRKERLAALTAVEKEADRLRKIAIAKRNRRLEAERQRAAQAAQQQEWRHQAQVAEQDRLRLEAERKRQRRLNTINMLGAIAQGVANAREGGNTGSPIVSGFCSNGEDPRSGCGELVRSDIRLKEDISRVGTAYNGLPLYRFKYTSQDGYYIGVMAQDVLPLYPSAIVIDRNGFYLVDYGALGLQMIAD